MRSIHELSGMVTGGVTGEEHILEVTEHMPRIVSKVVEIAEPNDSPESTVILGYN